MDEQTKPIATGTGSGLFTSIFVLLAICTVISLSAGILLPIFTEVEKTGDTVDNVWKAFFILIGHVTGMLSGKAVG